MNERDRLIELLSQYFNIGDSYAYNLKRDKSAFAIGTMSLDDFEEFDADTVADLADHLLANGVIVPPCKVGDYIEWDNGLCKKLHEVKGFNYCPGDLGLRFEIGICSPVVNHSAITRILTREEAEQALAERSGE